MCKYLALAHDKSLSYSNNLNSPAEYKGVNLMEIKWAKRIEELPPYLFAEIDRKKNEIIEKGVDVIDLGVGDPDIPTPDHIIVLKR